MLANKIYNILIAIYVQKKIITLLKVLNHSRIARKLKGSIMKEKKTKFITSFGNLAREISQQKIKNSNRQYELILGHTCQIYSKLLTRNLSTS